MSPQGTRRASIAYATGLQYVRARFGNRLCGGRLRALNHWFSGYQHAEMTVVGNTMNVRYRAIPASGPLARQARGDLAAAAGASAEKVEAIRLAVSEAMTNAVLHAYPQASGVVDVTAAVASGELWVLIADDGRGLHARS